MFRSEQADIGGEERESAEVKEKELLEKAGRGGSSAWAGYLTRLLEGTGARPAAIGKTEEEGACIGQRLDGHGLSEP
ncbi:hypothetical protein E2562_005293 [Oryza meyeriana var. granulata]|uniref:Uncharacterized protein n=1 Tax=Oryza meyeriana var. granulata TaxID=110450 RepID=A0A6G1EFZ8_9ORYZ|nr:hypothetical protein E2562_005293 [Oryza meyeriana var. granulata]